MTLHLDERATSGAATTWVAVCRLDELVPERGVAALVHGTQIAVFRLVDDSVWAVQQLDPFSDACVMSRGIVGSRAGAPTVASPMYKQVFDLRDGTCLDPMGKKAVDLIPYAVHVTDGVVHLALPSRSPDDTT
jgi:nitrite reductase (NADH) small subunit